MDLDKRFALIDNKGNKRYPYKKHQVKTNRYGYPLTRVGESDRHGGGDYVDDIETVILRMVLDGWSVRAKTPNGKGNTVGILKQPKKTIIGYEISGDLFYLVKSAILKPIKVTSKIPEQEEVTESKDSLETKEFPVDDKVYREIKTRRGQTEFRKMLLQAYDGKCFVSGSEVTSVLEAAHIVPHSEKTNYSVNNGVLLRADIHTLYDLNLIGIDKAGTVHISSSIIDSEYGLYDKQRTDNKLSIKHAENLQQRFSDFHTG